jgi:hypothetical protein
LLELPRAVGDRAGERALQVAEELALDEFRRDRRAVHLDERAVAPRRQRMDRARDEFLAGAVLSRDEDAGIRRPHAFEPLDESADRRRLPHDLVPRLDLLAQPHVLVLQPRVAQRVAQRDEDPVGVERLLEEIVGAQLRRLDRRLDRAVPADHDHERGGVEGAQALERLQSVDAAHLHVEEHDVRAPGFVRLERFRAARDRVHLVPLVFEQLAERGAHALLVVGDQQTLCHEPLR